MKYRPLKQADLMVSEVGFGTWTVTTGWWGDFSDEQAIALFQKAHENYGITFFDSSDAYGNGRSEELLGKAFAHCRDKVVIATKFGYDIYNDDRPSGQRERSMKTDPDYIRFACEQSLKRLNTDYIDMYQIHNAKMEHIDDNAIFETLEALKQEGKIRSYGVALGPAIGWLAEGVKSIRDRKVAALMVIHNMLEQHPGQTFLEESHRNDQITSMIVRVPHASGMLEGHYTLETTFDPKDHRSHRPKHWLVNGVNKVEQLRFLEKDNRTLGQAALQYLLADPVVATTLPNIYDEAQLKEFATYDKCPDLADEDIKRVDALVATNFGITDEPPMAYKGTMTYPERAVATV